MKIGIVRLKRTRIFAVLNFSLLINTNATKNEALKTIKISTINHRLDKSIIEYSAAKNTKLESAM
jgi:hypothetical protein